MAPLSDSLIKINNTVTRKKITKKQKTLLLAFKKSRPKKLKAIKFKSRQTQIKTKPN